MNDFLSFFNFTVLSDSNANLNVLTKKQKAIQFILFTLMSIESIWNRDRKTFQTNKKLSSSLSPSSFLTKMTSFLFYSLAFPVAMVCSSVLFNSILFHI